jgi:hypothetical protein
MQQVESLIGSDEDFFGALQLLHPAIYDHTLAYLRK